VSSRALVLGGGGVAGIAWETGLLFGLAEEGVDVLDADVIVGTSAGSAVAAQVTSGTPLAELHDKHAFPTEESAEIPVEFDIEKMVADWSALMTQSEPGQELRAAIGRYALAASTVPERRRREVIEARLPSHKWPDRDLRITAVDAETGEFRVLDRASGVPLLQAVAASCAVPGVYPPCTIDGRRYVDGGMRSAANADLAAGYGRVVVLAPIRRGAGPMASVDAQVAGLRARVAVVTPDEASRAAIGRNVLDPAARAPTARAGRAQAKSVLDRVADVWNGG